MCGLLINELIHLLHGIVSLRSSGHSYWADQEKFCLSWNQTFSVTYPQGPILGPILSHLISVHTLKSFFLISILLLSSNHAFVTDSLCSCCRYVDCFIIHKLVLSLWNLVIL